MVTLEPWVLAISASQDLKLIVQSRMYTISQSVSVMLMLHHVVDARDTLCHPGTPP